MLHTKISIGLISWLAIAWNIFWYVNSTKTYAGFNIKFLQVEVEKYLILKLKTKSPENTYNWML